MKKVENIEKMESYPWENDPRTGIPFEVPEGYFDRLTASIEKKKGLLENPSVNTSAFHVPENYFHQLPGLINERIARLKDPVPVRSIHLQRRIKSAAALAAAIAFGLFIYRLTIPSYIIHSSTSTAVITPAEIQESYLFEDLDESLISEMPLTSDGAETVNNEDVKSYLIENQIDLTSVDIEI